MNLEKEIVACGHVLWVSPLKHWPGQRSMAGSTSHLSNVRMSDILPQDTHDAVLQLFSVLGTPTRD